MFFLLAVSLLGALLTAVLLLGYGVWMLLIGIPVGASIGAALGGAIVAWQANRRFKAACEPSHVGSSVASGLRSVLAGSVSQPLPDELRELTDKLVSKRPGRSASVS